LQCVAVCCSVLQCVAVCCSVLQCVAVCCSVVQGVAVCCSVLQCVAVCCSVMFHCAVSLTLCGHANTCKQGEVERTMAKKSFVGELISRVSFCVYAYICIHKRHDSFIRDRTHS